MLLESVLLPVNDVLNRIHESEMVLARPKFHNLPGISASDLGHDYKVPGNGEEGGLAAHQTKGPASRAFRFT
jgi:hypothetical protein